MFPLTPPPQSAATANPYPGMNIFVPYGITDGSTATMPRVTVAPVLVMP